MYSFTLRVAKLVPPLVLPIAISELHLRLYLMSFLASLLRLLCQRLSACSSMSALNEATTRR